MPAPRDTHDSHTMQCMELWGGNRDIDTSLSTRGLDAWLFSEPYRGQSPGAGAGAEAGGDIHYLTSCATGRITRMLLADVSGHGETVAEAARSLKKLLGQHANYIDQTRFIGAVNRRFGDLGAAGQGLFATAVVATYFSPTDELTVCSAGHPPALLYNARAQAWSAVAPGREGQGPSNLPLGVLETSPYRQSTLTLGAGDLVLLYTDALIEAPTPAGDQLGVDGLMRVLSGLDTGQADRLIPSLLGAVGASAPGSFDDDVTVLLVRRNDNKPTPSLGLGLRAGLRLGKNLARAALGGEIAAPPEWSVRALVGAFIPRFNARRGRPSEG